jgi:hypothetical protein
VKLLAEFEEIKQSIGKTMKKNPYLWGGLLAAASIVGVVVYSKGETKTVDDTAYLSEYPSISGETSDTTDTSDSTLEAIKDLLENTVSYEDFLTFQDNVNNQTSETNAAVLDLLNSQYADIQSQFETQNETFQSVLNSSTQRTIEQAATVGTLETTAPTLSTSYEVIDEPAASLTTVPTNVKTLREGTIEYRQLSNGDVMKINYATGATVTVAAGSANMKYIPNSVGGTRDTLKSGSSVTAAGKTVTEGTIKYTPNSDGSVTKTDTATGRTVKVAAGSEDMKYIPSSVGGSRKETKPSTPKTTSSKSTNTSTPAVGEGKKAKDQSRTTAGGGGW